ncbi:hypothetical protein DCAR_0727375 [Daucus carota subsp. sativus]|uniref:Uncharacterized protein n=1 Tax=Daucus carota subsp. sativus TaxID=79200 RepID=A0A161ZIJ5_DAUCS|nr:hypothetical protein DCAR_0727375 [Daucus carota subsp. sativus]
MKDGKAIENAITVPMTVGDVIGLETIRQLTFIQQQGSSYIPPPAVLMPVPGRLNMFGCVFSAVRPFVPATLLKRQYTMYRGREILPYLKPARYKFAVWSPILQLPRSRYTRL